MSISTTATLEKPPDAEQRGRMQARRRNRYRLRALIARMGDHRAALARRVALDDDPWQAVPFRRTAGCGRILHGDDVTVHQVAGTAYVSGVSTCGSVWLCPVCEAKIRTGRALELRELATAHAATGGTVGMITLTVRHGPEHELAELMDVEGDAWRSIQQDDRWRGLTDEVAEIAGVQLVGFVRSWEVTQGFTADPKTGSWHPHFHVLLLWADDGDHTVDVDWIRQAWAQRIENRLGARPDSHGFDYRVIRAEDAEYVSKISDEITRVDLKGGSRSVWALVEHAAEGQVLSVFRWLDYCRATKGRSSVRTSRGLRARYGLDEAKTDAELAADDRDGTVIGTIAKDDWPAMMRCEWGSVPRIVAVLEHIEADEADNAHNVGCVDPREGPPPQPG